MVQQPGVRLARSLGFRKGTHASSYTQLYAAFALSALLHQANIFNVTRRDGGEARFFLSQAAAITAEDAVRWAWRALVSGRRKADPPTRAERLVGLACVFAWFSYCLPPFVGPLLAENVLLDAVAGARPLVVGEGLAREAVKLLRERGWNGLAKIAM